MTEDTTANTTGGCLPKVSNTWQFFVTALNFKHPVHPLGPVAPENSEFFMIDSKIRIRIIHVHPGNSSKPLSSVRYSVDYPYSKRNSLSEEYWFTKWNKPVKLGVCTCSFRRSLRFSLLPNQNDQNQSETETSKKSDSISLNVAPIRIVNMETFVERIVQESLLEAFQECYMIKYQGAVNLAYEKGDDETDGAVVMRKKSPPKLSTNCVTKQPKSGSASTAFGGKCVHKRGSVKKPFVFLFHGIGNSADVWWLIMNSLVNRGFEVIAPDLLGHGYSSAPDKASAYTFHNLLVHALAVFDHYVAQEERRKCILIGHSYGLDLQWRHIEYFDRCQKCSLVTALYRHRTEKISQLILISGGGPTPLAAPVKNSEISPFGCVHTLFKPLIFCGLKRSFLFSSRGKHFDVCDSDSAIPSQILRYISEGQSWPEGDAAFHRRILIPTLLVHGLQDKKVTLVQQCEMERTIPRAFLELIPNAGHMPMLETPEHLGHMILCFMDTWN